MNAPPPINPHVWRKFEQAQRNMKRFSFLYLRHYPRYSKKLYRRFSKWAREFDRQLHKLMAFKRNFPGQDTTPGR